MGINWAMAQVSTKTNLNDDHFKGIIYRKETTEIWGCTTNGWAVAVNFVKSERITEPGIIISNLAPCNSSAGAKINPKTSTSSAMSCLRNLSLANKTAFYYQMGKGFKRYLSDKARRKGGNWLQSWSRSGNSFIETFTTSSLLNR